RRPRHETRYGSRGAPRRCPRGGARGMAPLSPALDRRRGDRRGGRHAALGLGHHGSEDQALRARVRQSPRPPPPPPPPLTHRPARGPGAPGGDGVIVPAYTSTATAEAVTYLGARPVLADVDPVTCNLRAEDVARAFTARTRAVIPVHIAGLPCDMDPILDVARRRGLAVAEDAAHALPARDRGRWVGTLGDAAAFSFYATKNITAGEGGMLVVREAQVAERARILALHGISRDAWKRYTAAGHWRYEVLANGYKYNLSDLAASLGLAQLRKLARFHARRRRLAARYDRGLADADRI